MRNEWGNERKPQIIQQKTANSLLHCSQCPSVRDHLYLTVGTKEYARHCIMGFDSWWLLASSIFASCLISFIFLTVYVLPVLKWGWKCVQYLERLYIVDKVGEYNIVLVLVVANATGMNHPMLMKQFFSELLHIPQYSILCRILHCPKINLTHFSSSLHH